MDNNRISCHHRQHGCIAAILSIPHVMMLNVCMGGLYYWRDSF